MRNNNQRDFLCLSHLRWGFVYQRPQHLMSRFAREYRVFYIEEPFRSDEPTHYKEFIDADSGVHIIAPYIHNDVRAEELEREQRRLLDRVIREKEIGPEVLWYYTPMALGFSGHIKAPVVVYDCMDELSGFKDAPALLHDREKELFRRASLVFTGGQSLFEAKRGQHQHIHAFPSSIEFEHFAGAREPQGDPADQAGIAHPRIGYCGVIDERMDLALVDAVAEAHPEWQLIMLGPVVKIAPESLPSRANIHWLGGKKYKELPAYLAGWDAAMLPFAHNASTRFISPTKTPEYLAAGKPVVSTSIRDVVRPYGELALVHIADSAEEFSAAIDRALNTERGEWLPRVDAFLARSSWDLTWRRMAALIGERSATASITPGNIISAVGVTM